MEKGARKEMAEFPEITLHLLAVPHTLTSPDFCSSCAFAGKVLRFAPMIHHQPGFKVIHYGVEGSQSGADEEVQVLSLNEWNLLRVQSLIDADPKLTAEIAQQRLADPTSFVGDLGNSNNVLYKTFNANARKLLSEKIEGSDRMHIVCLPFGLGHVQAIEKKPWVCVESGIGYPESFLNYRIFESEEWLHANQGKKSGVNYWFVCPNYYDIREWEFCEAPTKLNEVHFLGRIQDCKGLLELVACAERMPDVTFVICGQGDPKPYLRPNVVYKPPVQGRERSEFLGNCACVLTPTQFVEPFCGVSAEAQLCGTPVVSKAYGAFNTNVEQFATGVKAHTLQDLVEGIRAAQRGDFDRRYIRERAVRLWGYEAVAKQYAYAFRTIADVHNGANGWYAPVSHLHLLEGSVVSPPE
jgi:glycosyltransferase involved in cell wall biosynthesis